MGILIFLVVIALVVIMFVALTKEDETEKERKNLLEKQLEERNIERTIEYDLKHAHRYIFYKYIVDNTNKNIVLAHAHSLRDTGDYGTLVQDVNDITTIRFADLIGVEGVADGHVTSGIKRAVIGGAIAGDAGAVVGAMTAKKEIMLYKIVFYTKDIANPTIEMILLNEKTKTDDYYYKQCVEFTRKIEASVRAILANN